MSQIDFVRHRGLVVMALWLVTLPVAAQAMASASRTGSLIQPDTYRGLVADRRAHRIGDTLTVIIAETASASASANTGGANDVRIGASGQTPHRTYPYAIGLSGSDQGQGETSRSGALNALLTVRVVGIDKDGLLRVRGERTVVVNGEKQHIALEGLVREQDILASNVIPSSRISDARIEFTGQGDVSEAQKRSVIYRFMKWLGLL
jgi:flagellar L-ring protein precursor FlgH